mmetsp:Transcript_15703/g.31652  ORF Transcript_15703/g.31652 Transcript_15703/m.31652 type:complete len:230 (-) Transcript_15703:517-1206(-)
MSSLLLQQLQWSNPNEVFRRREVVLVEDTWLCSSSLLMASLLGWLKPHRIIWVESDLADPWRCGSPNISEKNSDVHLTVSNPDQWTEVSAICSAKRIVVVWNDLWGLREHLEPHSLERWLGASRVAFPEGTMALTLVRLAADTEDEQWVRELRHWADSIIAMRPLVTGPAREVDGQVVIAKSQGVWIESLEDDKIAGRNAAHEHAPSTPLARRPIFYKIRSSGIHYLHL